MCTAYGIVTCNEWSWWPCSTQVGRELVTIPYAVHVISPPEDEHNTVRNM
jgi:hypothetical protein